MARLSFKQGIVRHQTDTNGNPTFLQKVGQYVNLIISQDQTIITFTHGIKDYLFTESVTQESAWGPFSTGIDYWLYWDLNRVTGIRTFGFTGYEPITAATAPTSPATGQMWFNSGTNLMYEFNGASWVEVIRVFSCKLEGGITFVSMSIDAPLFTGTQVGLTVSSSIGSLVFDTSGKPIFNGYGKFFTTEDVFTTGVPTGASLKINNILIRAQSQQPIASYHVVEFIEYNQIVPAPAFSIIDKVYGIIEEDVVTNEVANVITEGIIFNESWDWPVAGGDINDPVYITNAGEITLTETIPNQVVVGAIVGPQSILFSPGLYGLTGEIGGGGTADHGLLLGLEDDDHIQYHNDTRGDIRYYTKDIANTTFAPVIHTHVKADITDFAHTHTEDVKVAGDTMTGFLTLHADPTTALHAATKQYVDTLVAAGIKWIEPVVTSIFKGVVNDPVAFTPTADFDAYIVGDTPAGDFIGFASGTLVSYNGATWVDILPSGPIQIGDRLGVAIHPSEYPPLNVDAGVSAILGKIVEITDNTPGSITWTVITPDETDAFFLSNPDAPHFGHSYTFSGTWGTGVYGTDYFWIEFQSGLDYIGGTNITITGKTIDVSPQGAASGLDADLWDGEQSNISGAVAGETLVYNETTAWENGYSTRISNAGGTTSISSDVTTDTLILTSTAIEVHDIVAANGATMRLYEGSTNGTNSVEIGAPALLAADTIFTFPPTNGTVDQVLRTDGNGITTWVSAGGGSAFCLIDGDTDTFVSVGYLATPCQDDDNNVLRLQTGNNAAEASGPIQLYTGNNAETGQNSGAVDILTGTPGFDGNSGAISLTTSPGNNIGDSGAISLATGSGGLGNNGKSGNVTLNSGVTQTGSSGNALFKSGNVGIDENESAVQVFTGTMTIQTGDAYGETSASTTVPQTGILYLKTGTTNNPGQTFDSWQNGTANSGLIEMQTGNVNGKYNTGNSGGINITTGSCNGYKGLQNSGSINIRTGTSGNIGGNTGDIHLQAGLAQSYQPGDTGTGGDIIIESGNSNTVDAAGSITLSGGDGTGDNDSGSVLIQTGVVGSIDAVAAGVEIRARGALQSGNITLIAEGGTQHASDVTGAHIDLSPGSNGFVGQQGHVRLFRQSNATDVIPEFRFQTSTLAFSELGKYVALRAPNALTTGPSYRLTLPLNDDAMEDGTMLVANASGDLQFQQAPYDINIQGFGALTNGDILGRYMVPRSITLKATGHIGLAQTAPVTTDATFTVYTSTGAGALTSIGTIVFAAASQTVASASFTTDRVLAIGDVITIECTTASSIEDVTITLLGKLSYI